MEYKLHERRTGLFSFLVLSLVPVKISDRGGSMMISLKDNPLPSHVIHNPLLFTQLKKCHKEICIIYKYLLLHNECICIQCIFQIKTNILHTQMRTLVCICVNIQYGM